MATERKEKKINENTHTPKSKQTQKKKEKRNTISYIHWPCDETAKMQTCRDLYIQWEPIVNREKKRKKEYCGFCLPRTRSFLTNEKGGLDKFS